MDDVQLVVCIVVVAVVEEEAGRSCNCNRWYCAVCVSME